MTKEQWRLAAGYVTKNLTADEVELVKKLQATNNDFKYALDDLTAAYQHAEGFRLTFDDQRGMQLMRQKIYATRRRTRHLAFLRIAAAVLLLFGGGWLLWSPQRQVEQVFEFSAQAAEDHAPVELPDGSLVYLNGGTKLSYRSSFGLSGREVYVDGDAFFDVVPNADKPFKVETPGLTAQVLGTSFRIRRDAQHDQIEVLVATGKVAVSHGEQMLSELTPGEGIRFDSKQRSYQRIDRPIEAIEGLKNKSLFFNETPLEEVCTELERWFGVQVRCANKSVSSNLISGEFRQVALEEILASIAMSSNLRYRKQAGIIYLENKH